MAKADIIHPSELTAIETVAWLRLQSGAPELGSPLLGPGFAQAVGAVRPDARVAIWRDGRRSAGFLGFHPTVGGFARPIGAPFCDYHALISGPNFPPAAEAMQAAGLNGMQLTGLVDPHGLYPAGLEQISAHRIDLALGGEAFGGLMIGLYAGDRPVAAHFGVRQDGWYHPWLGAYDPELAGFSPGLVHQVMAAAAAAGIGIDTYDLGPRADRAKAMFANTTVTVGQGVVAAGDSLHGALAVRTGRLLSHASGPLGLVDRMRRRWDHVAAVELTLGGRVAGMARAVGSLNRRMDAWSKAA